MKPNEKHSENRDLLKVAARAARFAAGPTPSPQNGKTNYKGWTKTLIGQPVTPTRHCTMLLAMTRRRAWCPGALVVEPEWRNLNLRPNRKIRESTLCDKELPDIKCAFPVGQLKHET